MTSRRLLEERVDELAARQSGREFASAVRRLHDELEPEERELLRAILLERAANVDAAVLERVQTRGWLRRQWDKAGGGR
jgi:hypothetical protein